MARPLSSLRRPQLKTIRYTAPENLSLRLSLADALPIQGSYSTVFRLGQPGRVVKLYKSPMYRDGPLGLTAEAELAFREAWLAECEAYRLLAADPTTGNAAPAFYGSPPITQVVSQDGEDVSVRYLLDCTLELELLGGECRKLHELSGTQLIAAEQLQEQLRSVGIGQVADMSFFLDPTGHGLRGIDFATWDAAAKVREILLAGGSNADAIRARWSDV